MQLLQNITAEFGIHSLGSRDTFLVLKSLDVIENDHHALDIPFWLPGLFWVLITLDVSTGMIAALSLGHNYKPILTLVMTLDKMVSSSKASCWNSVIHTLLHLVSYICPGTNLATMWYISSSPVRIFWHLLEQIPTYSQTAQKRQMSILNELMDLCDTVQSYAGQGPSSMVIIINDVQLALNAT